MDLYILNKITKKNKLITNTKYTNIKELNINNIENDIKNNIIIENYKDLIFLPFNKYENINIILINSKYEDNPKLHLLGNLNKDIYFSYSKNNDSYDLNKCIQNPFVSGFFDSDITNINSINYDNILKDNEIHTQIDILNDICYFDITRILKYYNQNINIEKSYHFLLDKFKLVWHKFKVYSINNIDKSNDNTTIINFYQKLMGDLGELINCHPVNDKNKPFSISRDIKYIPNSKHFYSSNIRQPLHNDYAYYPDKISPDWLLLFCLEKSEYGGFTSLIDNKYLISILKKYNPLLLDKIMNLELTYRYEDIEKGELIHNNLLVNSNNIMNWNYFQIKDKYNTDKVITICADFFKFLEKIITDGDIHTIKKDWTPGDGLLFNDHLTLHQRTSFLGSRWLKDFAITDKLLPLQ